MNIAIWGAGKFGQYIFSQLEADKDTNVVCFIDSNAGGGYMVKGVDVVTPDVYMERYAAKTEAVLVAFFGGMRLLEQLQGLGIQRFGFIRQRVYACQLPLQHIELGDKNIIWNNDNDVFTKTFMSTLETNVVDYCNLNCKGCSHFSNLFPKGSEIPFEIFERDIKQLSTKVFISQFNLLGGEVLLSGSLTDYISCLKKYMPKTQVELVSNGLLIPYQKEEVLECIRDNDVTVSITEYPPTTTVLQKIEDRLQKYQIPYSVRSLVKTFGKNIDISGGNIPGIAMMNCRESKCQFLRDGKLYKCPFAALGNYFFEHYEIPIRLNEGIDIYDNALDWKEEIRRLCNEPIETCRYCGMEERFAWGRSDSPAKEEWLLEELQQ